MERYWRAPKGRDMERLCYKDIAGTIRDKPIARKVNIAYWLKNKAINAFNFCG